MGDSARVRTSSDTDHKDNPARARLRTFSRCSSQNTVSFRRNGRFVCGALASPALPTITGGRAGGLRAHGTAHDSKQCLIMRSLHDKTPAHAHHMTHVHVTCTCACACACTCACSPRAHTTRRRRLAVSLSTGTKSGVGGRQRARWSPPPDRCLPPSCCLLHSRLSCAALCIERMIDPAAPRLVSSL